MHRDDRFSRSIQEPDPTSRRLNAGCRAGSPPGSLPCLSRKKRPPPVSASVKAFRHFIDGSLALASPDHTCRNLVPAFLQRSPRSLLTTAACSGLRPAPDCRPRGAYPHLSYSTTPPYSVDVFVTHDAFFRSLACAHRVSFIPTPAANHGYRDSARISPMKTLGLRSSGCDIVQLGQIVFGKDQGWRGKILPQVRDR